MTVTHIVATHVSPGSPNQPIEISLQERVGMSVVDSIVIGQFQIQQAMVTFSALKGLFPGVAPGDAIISIGTTEWFT